MQAWPLCARAHQQTSTTPKLTTILHVQANKFFLSFITLENCNMASITKLTCISQLLAQWALFFQPNILVYISGNFQGKSPGKRSTSRVIPNCFKKISDRECPFHLILFPESSAEWFNNLFGNFPTKFPYPLPKFRRFKNFSPNGKGPMWQKCCSATCLVVQTLDKRLKIFLGTVQEPIKRKIC